MVAYFRIATYGSQAGGLHHMLQTLQSLEPRVSTTGGFTTCIVQVLSALPTTFSQVTRDSLGDSLTMGPPSAALGVIGRAWDPPWHDPCYDTKRAKLKRDRLARSLLTSRYKTARAKVLRFAALLVYSWRTATPFAIGHAILTAVAFA